MSFIESWSDLIRVKFFLLAVHASLPRLDQLFDAIDGVIRLAFNHAAKKINNICQKLQKINKNCKKN
jgi:hypothetical protein